MAQALTTNLTLIPPSQITTQVMLDIRGGIYNHTQQPQTVDVAVYLDTENTQNQIYTTAVKMAAGENAEVKVRWPGCDHVGKHEIIFVVTCGSQCYRATQPIEITESAIRSTESIDGAWVSIIHWSEVESRLWREDNEKMTDEQWGELVRAMKEVGMDTVVIQETFRNQLYLGMHNIEHEGYHGKAFYPSNLYSGRVEMAAKNPLETILSEADKLDMHVFMGVGLYAWFDLTPASLKWHIKVTDELWQMYGHHQSFYGWYVSEESFGNFSDNDSRRMEVVTFFEKFTAHCRRISPEKPVMLAPNCHFVEQALEYWPRLLAHLDIVCPFGFHRMPTGDISGERAAELLQKLCDEAGSHLWMDMETFLFAEDGALVPRPIDGLLDDMRRFPNFEKILCYQFPGLFNAPWMSIKPGGDDTVRLFNDYKRYLETKRQ